MRRSVKIGKFPFVKNPNVSFEETIRSLTFEGQK